MIQTSTLQSKPMMHDCDGVITSNDCDDDDATVQNMGESNSCPAISCLEIYNAGDASGDGLYWLEPVDQNPSNAFEAYCYMEGDWPGSTLVITTPGTFSPELHTSARGGTPMNDSTSYVKFSDATINALKKIHLILSIHIFHEQPKVTIVVVKVVTVLALFKRVAILIWEVQQVVAVKILGSVKTAQRIVDVHRQQVVTAVLMVTIVIIQVVVMLGGVMPMQTTSS